MPVIQCRAALYVTFLTPFPPYNPIQTVIRQRIFHGLLAPSDCIAISSSRSAFQHPLNLVRPPGKLRWGKRFAFHLLKRKAQRTRNRMRTTVEIITPDHDRLTCRKDAFVFGHIAYLVRPTRTTRTPTSTRSERIKGSSYVQEISLTSRP